MGPYLGQRILSPVAWNNPALGVRPKRGQPWDVENTHRIDPLARKMPGIPVGFIPPEVMLLPELRRIARERIA
jgi:hypothetical protein